MVPEEGLEPSQGYPYRILSPNKLSLGIIRGERRGDSSMFCRTGVCALVLLRVASLGTVTGTVLDYPSCNESTNPKLSGRVDLNTPIRNADQVESVCNPKWLRRFCCFWRILWVLRKHCSKHVHGNKRDGNNHSHEEELFPLLRLRTFDN